MITIKELYFKYLNGEIPWEETGLLQSLAEEQKPQIIELYSMLKPYFEADDDYCEFYLPIIMRIYVELLNLNRSKFGHDLTQECKMYLYLLINPHDVVKHTKIGFNNVKKALQTFENVDHDVELCRLISDNYIREIVKNLNDSNIKERLRQLNRDRKIDNIFNI